MSIQNKFYNAIQNNDIQDIKSLLNHPKVDPCELNNWSIHLAVKVQSIEAVKLLLNDKRVDPSDDNNLSHESLPPKDGSFPFFYGES